LATVAGGWAANANETARALALVALGLAGLAMAAPKLATLWARPLVALGTRLGDAAQRAAHDDRRSLWPPFGVGVATGLLWAPCAGPVLGLVLSTAVLQGPSARTALLLLAYAAGAATSLALALWAGGRVFAAMKRTLRVGEWVRKAVGIAVLASVAAIAFGLDTGVLARWSSSGSEALEQHLLQRWHRKAAVGVHDAAVRAAPATLRGDAAAHLWRVAAAAPVLPVEGRLPELAGVTGWLNSPPLTRDSLRGKVVLIDFWTFACINCLHALPHVREWAEKYKDQGLVVIGVHSPEFAYERKLDNVRRAVRDLGLGFPIAIDNDFAVWRAFSNEYWPAHYFVDAQGRIRHHKFGEGDYERSEQVLRQLLDEARASPSGT